MFTQSKYSLRKRMNKNVVSRVNRSTNVGSEIESTIQNDQSKDFKEVHVKLEESEELFSTTTTTSYPFDENVSIAIKKEPVVDESTFMNIIQGTPECLVENEFSEETPVERNKTYLDLEDDNSSNSNKRIRTRERRPVVIPASLDDSLPYNQFESDPEPEKELSQESDYDFVRNNDIQVDNTLLSASIDDDSSNMDESEFEEYDTTDDTLVVKESYPVKKIVGVRTRSQTKKHQLLMMNRDNVGTEVGRKPFSEQGENIQRNIPSKRKHYDSALDDENEQIIGKPPKGRVYYCPYQKCNYNCSDHISSLFKHFRNQHDSTFPKMYRTDIFMSPLGKNIDFTANSKNLLKKGDRIRLLFHNDCDEEKPYCCPYQECNYNSIKYKSLTYIYDHIRKYHDPQFPRCLSGTSPLFITSSEQIVSFKEMSRNLLKPGEQMILTRKIFYEQDRLQQSYFCPYQKCRTIRKRLSWLFLHIREQHNPDFPRLRKGTPASKVIFKTVSGQIIDFRESSRNTFRYNKDTVLIEQEGCQDQVYFCCPYKNCDSKCVKKLSLLGHLRKKHSVDLPQFNQIGSSSYIFKTCSGKVLDFSKDHGVLNRNEKILYELKSADDQMLYKDQHRLYYCPYQACSRLVTFRKPSPFYSHIRSHHDKDFPLMTNRRSRSYVFKTTSGIIVDFRDNKQKLLRKNDKIRFEEKSPKGKFYCPYKGCKTSYFRRVIVINHIRDSHHLMSPPGITSHKIVFKTVSGQNIDLSVSQNLLQPEETLFVENPKGDFRCPYEGCSRSGNCRSFILDHIRHRHYSNLPLLKHSNIMVPLKSSSGEIIDFSENSQTVLKEGDKIITPEEDDDVDKGQYFYCPYQGCNTRKGFRNSFVSHIRERHYRGIKKLFKLRDGQCYVFKTSTGQVIDFNNAEDSHNLLKNGDKILVEKEYL